MKNFTLFCFFALILMLIGFSIRAVAAVTNWPSADQQYLMVDQRGTIVPEGYTAGLTDIARAEAKAEAARIAAGLVRETAESASNIVDGVVSALTGAFGFAYVTGHTVALSGSVEVSTNASAYIVFFQPGAAGNMSTNGVGYTGHYVWHVYSEEMNTAPVIKYKTNLDATNDWEFVEYQSTAEFSNTTVNGVGYETVYRSTVWLPGELDSSFFMAFCEIAGGGQAGGVLVVEKGFSINGKVGITGDVVENGYRKHYECGALMSVTNEVPQ